MRVILRVFTVGVLGLFVGGIGFIFLCAMFLPPPSASPRPYSEQGFVRTGTQFHSPRFSADGAELFFERVELFRHPVTGESREGRDVVGVPTLTSKPGAPSPRDLGRIEWFLGRLLLLGGLMPSAGEVAVSPGGTAMAYSTPDGVYLKGGSGRWVCLYGQGLPRELLRLNDSPREVHTLQERLAHPDLLIWMDAALELLLVDGVQAGLFSDALLRIYRDRRALREPLVELLFKAGDPHVIVRTILELSDDGLFRRSILDRLERGENAEGRRGRARVLAWMARPDWVGYVIGPYLKDYLVRCLEDSIFDLLSEEDRRAPFERMIRVLDASHFGRLARIIENQEGLSAVAAWLILCHVSGEPRGGFPRAGQVLIAKRWWAENRVRLENLLRE